MNYEITSARVGEHQKFLDEQWEPFGVSGHDTSYIFYNTSDQRDEVHHQTTDIIYFRREKIRELEA